MKNHAQTWTKAGIIFLSILMFGYSAMPGQVAAQQPATDTTHKLHLLARLQY
jgi:hypothetical protein